MYRHCIYCLADLGANEALEGFPIGRMLAFDAAKGRLWAVCGKCSRWNLAPIEERWEPLEAAEKAFAETRMRVQRENIGIAKLRDGTRLVRVGAALTGELAAWRYGDHFARRQRRAMWIGWAGYAASATAIGITVVGFLPSALMLGAPAGLWWLGSLVRDQMLGNRPVHHLSARGSSGSPLVLRRKHLDGARLVPGDDGEPALLLPRAPQSGCQVEGPEANRLLQRIMVVRNRRGATRAELEPALALLASAGSAKELIGRAVRSRRELAMVGGLDEPLPGKAPADLQPVRKPVEWKAASSTPDALALEMALHEESERRALEGELTLLESAWREAEEIASIADRLAGEAVLAR